MDAATVGLHLMERAGRATVDAVVAEWPDLAVGPHRAVVLCGPGNNGGDGFVVARLLQGRGWDVICFLHGKAEALPPDAWANYVRWMELGGRTDPMEGCTAACFAPDGRGRRPLAIDAVFGIGLARPTPGPVVDALAAADGARAVALDVPSILNADTGALVCDWPHARPAADLTVTFQAPKPGHHLGRGPEVCGRLRVVDIGLTDVVPHPGLAPGSRGAGGASPGRDVGPATLVTASAIRDHVRKTGGHKYDHGHAVVLVGAFGRTGAGRLAARAALRIGAGLVTVAAPGSGMIECAAQLTAVMLRRCDEADAFAALAQDDRLNALCVGPGLGTDDRARAMVAAVLDADRATVLDADALTLVAGDDILRAALHDRCLLTPHMGEFRRLCPDLEDRLDRSVQSLSDPREAVDRSVYSKLDAVRDAARRLGCTILLKGPDTCIADPSGRAAIHAAACDRAAPWLATAGAGDVLAGIAAGLMARGLAPFDAACAGAWVHVEAALDFGPGLIAEDLPERIPAALRRLAADQ